MESNGGEPGLPRQEIHWNVLSDMGEHGEQTIRQVVLGELLDKLFPSVFERQKQAKENNDYSALGNIGMSIQRIRAEGGLPTREELDTVANEIVNDKDDMQARFNEKMNYLFEKYKEINENVRTSVAEKYGDEV